MDETNVDCPHLDVRAIVGYFEIEMHDSAPACETAYPHVNIIYIFL